MKKNTVEEFVKLFNQELSDERFDKIYIINVVENLTFKEVKTFIDLINQKKIQNAEKFDKLYKKLKKSKKHKKKEKIVQKETYIEWSQQDLKKLVKASKKYPPGTHNRWEKVARILGEKFTANQIALKVRNLKSNKDSLSS